ncbi:MAG: hypothetical protein AAF492_22825, partial [Verrucomicrobiota bacterium]
NESIEQKLRQAWKKEQQFYHLRGASRLAVWAVVMILVSLLIDWQILFRSRIAGEELQLLLVINVVVLIWVLWHEWLRHLKPYDPESVALEVESKHPELHSMLISYIQFKDVEIDESVASPALIEAMKNQVVTKTSPMDFREVIDFRQLKNLLIVAGLTILMFAGISYRWTTHVKTLFLRMAGVEENYPTETKILEVDPGNRIVKQGGSVTLSIQAAGKLPETGQLFVRSRGDRSWQMLPLDKKGRDQYVRELSECYEDMFYRVVINDARSEDYAITVSPPPEVVGVEVKLQYPDYIREEGAADVAVSELNMDVPMDTKITWAIECKPAVSSLKVTLGDEVIEAELDSDGLKATFEATATNTFKYTFIWVERENGFAYDDVQHVVRVVDDRLPDVELLRPAGDRLATVNKKVKIEEGKVTEMDLELAFDRAAWDKKPKPTPLDKLPAPQLTIPE